MDLDDALLVQRQAARIGELEGWLALLVVIHGARNGSGYQYQLNGEDAQKVRALLTSPSPVVAIEYHYRSHRHIIDVL